MAGISLYEVTVAMSIKQAYRWNGVSHFNNAIYFSQKTSGSYTDSGKGYMQKAVDWYSIREAGVTNCPSRDFGKSSNIKQIYLNNFCIGGKDQYYNYIGFTDKDKLGPGTDGQYYYNNAGTKYNSIYGDGWFMLYDNLGEYDATPVEILWYNDQYLEYKIGGVTYEFQIPHGKLIPYIVYQQNGGSITIPKREMTARTGPDTTFNTGTRVEDIQASAEKHTVWFQTTWTYTIAICYGLYGTGIGIMGEMKNFFSDFQRATYTIPNTVLKIKSLEQGNERTWNFDTSGALEKQIEGIFGPYHQKTVTSTIKLETGTVVMENTSGTYNWDKAVLAVGHIQLNNFEATARGSKGTTVGTNSTSFKMWYHNYGHSGSFRNSISCDLHYARSATNYRDLDEDIPADWENAWISEVDSFNTNYAKPFYHRKIYGVLEFPSDTVQYTVDKVYDNQTWYQNMAGVDIGLEFTLTNKQNSKPDQNRFYGCSLMVHVINNKD